MLWFSVPASSRTYLPFLWTNVVLLLFWYPSDADAIFFASTEELQSMPLSSEPFYGIWFYVKRDGSVLASMEARRKRFPTKDG